MKRLLFGLLALLISTTALAGTDSNATIFLVLPQASGQVFVYVSPNISNVPACGSGNPNRFVVDSTTPGGQAIVASVLLAYAQSRKIDFVGTGNCSVWGDTESVWYIVVH